MKTEQDGKPRKGLPVHPDHAGTFYRVAWRNGKETREDTEAYTAFDTAVEIADCLQIAANDRPMNIQFSVVRKTGNQSETVYRSEQ